MFFFPILPTFIYIKKTMQYPEMIILTEKFLLKRDNDVSKK